MNNLFKHIEYLLIRHDCVIVPGLGAFIASRIPARIDMDKRIILPPTRQTAFNQAVTADDGLLANSYVRKYGCTFDEARQIIVRQVAFLKSFLYANREAKVGSLGKLMLGVEDNLVFSPNMESDAFSLTMGYCEVGASNHRESLLADNDSELPSADEKERRNFFRLRKSFSKVAVAAVLAFVIGVALLINPMPADNREQRASVVPVEALMPQKPASEKVAVAPAPMPEVAVVEETKTLPMHYLIIATFTNPGEAAAYVERYSSETTPLEIVSSKRMTRVAIASSHDRETLRAKLNSSEISRQYPNAWIWSSK